MLALRCSTRANTGLRASSQLNARSGIKTGIQTASISLRTHTCGDLRLKDAGERVTLSGWLLPERKVSKNMSFFSIRDARGVIQVLAKRPKAAVEEEDDVLSRMSQTPVESVVQVQGTVKARPESAKGTSESAAEVEVIVDDFVVLNAADANLPFYPHDEHNLANEDLRARYRYLDLRRPALANNIRRRSEATHLIRNLLSDNGFTEVETPLLLKSTPEGAREYLVPSRTTTSPPQFYALSQSPQQPKQLLICSGGIDKYFQFAKCFRDEDGRKDRQPEFTQIDLEMAFVSQTGEGEWRVGGGEVRDVTERIVRGVWKRFLNVDLPPRFDVMTYREAMNRFGSDKPDIRFGLEIEQIEHNGDEVVECFTIPADPTTPEMRALKKAEEELALGEEGSARRVVEQGEVKWISTRKSYVNAGWTDLGRLRIRIAELAQQKYGLELPQTKILWVTEFPLFTKDEDKEFMAHGRWSSSHHPFTAPMQQDLELLQQGKVEQVRGQHYDLVVNGVEIGGGSVRIHDPKLQERVFRNILQLIEGEIASFEHLLHALKCGAPPHGGIALGFDRLMSIICGTKSIRDVIAFPKTAGGTDPVFKSPSAVGDEVLKAYGLRSL